MKTNRIPKALIRPYVEEYISTREMGEIHREGANHPWRVNQDGLYDADYGPNHGKTSQKYSAQQVLAEEAGLPLRRIWEIRYTEGNVLFETADKILCAMDKPHAWHEDPLLHEFYKKLSESDGKV